jgi:hypothetical protein
MVFLLLLKDVYYCVKTETREGRIDGNHWYSLSMYRVWWYIDIYVWMYNISIVVSSISHHITLQHHRGNIRGPSVILSLVLAHGKGCSESSKSTYSRKKQNLKIHATEA